MVSVPIWEILHGDKQANTLLELNKFCHFYFTSEYIVVIYYISFILILAMSASFIPLEVREYIRLNKLNEEIRGNANIIGANFYTIFNMFNNLNLFKDLK